MRELRKLLPDVIDAVRAAGEQIERIRVSKILEQNEKSPDDPVTLADRTSDAILNQRLLQLERIGWLSEETADSPERQSADAVWVVDPLDGTKEFIEGVPQYAISVGLAVDGQAALGVIHNPASGHMFSAIAGGGAFSDGVPIRVAEGNALLGSRSEIRRGEFESFGAWSIDAIGSIALKLALVASGTAAVTLSRGPKWEWDVCAGSLLVREAGGTSLDMFGEALRFNQEFPKVRGILAGAPLAVSRMREQLSELGPSERMTTGWAT